MLICRKELTFKTQYLHDFWFRSRSIELNLWTFGKSEVTSNDCIMELFSSSVSTEVSLAMLKSSRLSLSAEKIKTLSKAYKYFISLYKFKTKIYEVKFNFNLIDLAIYKFNILAQFSQLTILFVMKLWQL